MTRAARRRPWYAGPVMPERQRRRLDEIVGELLAPLLHAQPRPGGWRLAGWDVEQGICVTIARGDEWVLIEFERRDGSRPCFARTLRFNVHARHAFASSRPLGEQARRAVEQLVAMVRQREQALPLLPRETTTRHAEVREIEVERMLMPQGPGHYYLNAYAGCMIGCPFCYVAERADLSRELEGRPSLPWGRYVDVKINAAEVLRREVETLPPGFVRMSPILTDPYQPIERTYRITRQCLEVLVDRGFTPGILTRAGRVREDIDLLSRFPRAMVGISIPTDDDEIRKIFEPGGDPIDERIDAIEACHRAGLVTIAVVQPMLPMDPEKLASRLAGFARVVRIDRMYEIERARPLYERAGRLDAMTDEFFATTEASLRQALGARGVSVDPVDDLSFLLDG
jgi:DNA repair photolyase